MCDVGYIATLGIYMYCDQGRTNVLAAAGGREPGRNLPATQRDGSPHGRSERDEALGDHRRCGVARAECVRTHRRSEFPSLAFRLIIFGFNVPLIYGAVLADASVTSIFFVRSLASAF